MGTLEQMRRGLGQTWDQLTEGWRQIRERAAGALTRFNPSHHGGELETAEDRVVSSASRWGLIATEVRESDDQIVVRLELPGMDKDDFDIAVEQDYLVVRGEKRVEREQRQGHYYLMECAYGNFERAVPLPTAVQEDGAKATYRRGVLEIALPKAQAARRRRIPVQSR